ncbi:MAG: hypothetical protein AAF744_06200 [Pseudomonadota bacterium]
MAVAFAALAWPAAALTQYDCVVSEFRSSGADPVFDRRNKQKTFEILRKEDEFVVFSKSEVFDDSERRYAIHRKGTLDVVALSQNAVSHYTLVMPADPNGDVKREGYFEASITTQSNFYVNAWFLRCIN